MLPGFATLLAIPSSDQTYVATGAFFRASWLTRSATQRLWTIIAGPDSIGCFTVGITSGSVNHQSFPAHLERVRESSDLANPHHLR